MTSPLTHVSQNTWDSLSEPMIAPTGFREYDARWQFPEEINLPGMTAVGLGLGTQLKRRGIRPEISVGNDFRDYSVAVKNALVLGLVQAGIVVKDIGTALSPMAYFSQFHLDTPAVAMVTASHNPNGWTGVKMGFERPLTHGPEEMAELRDIILKGEGLASDGGGWHRIDGVRDAYIDDLCGDFRMSRPLKVVCATGNGTAGRFAPDILSRIGVDVVPLHTELDYTFPHYNPNPEALEMLRDMSRCVLAHQADFALGFDGDGDRCGFVDDTGTEVFADKVGVIFARDLARWHAEPTFVADVKSTGLFVSDPVLRDLGAKTTYWRTGHSHMKRRIKELNALAGFERSGHFFLAPPIGRGYDCAMRAAVEFCKLMDRNPASRVSDLRHALPQTWSTPTMSPPCSDLEKYEVLGRLEAKLTAHAASGKKFANRTISSVASLNGIRVTLDNGAWGMIRASSNTPNLVFVCESPESDADLRAIVADFDIVLRTEHGVGRYDQDF